ncbi:MAG TPA: DUF6599 family protein [Polyangiaceae bacterium]|nr:DUF6599 family protein [Polyangiaceae bacterium]
MMRHRQSLLLLVAFVACKKSPDPSEGAAPPPPVESSQPGACASGGGTVKDAVSEPHLPRLAGDYCIDPHGEAKTFGEQAGAPLDAVCDLFDGECEVYKRFGLERVVTVQYIDGKGSPGTVTVTLSRFDSPEAAYGFFTKRVVADGDPLEVAPAPLDAGAAGALGTGMAYVYRGEMVAELRYVHELESPEQIKASSARVLPVVAKALGDRLPGEKTVPVAAVRLPEANRIPSGVHYEYRDLFGVSGAGRGAVGFYQDGKQRYRVLMGVRADEEAAKDTLRTLSRLEGAHRIKGAAYEAHVVPVRESDGAPKAEWVVGRMGSLVAGVGDDAFQLAKEGVDAPRLTDSQKLLKLQALLASGGSAPASAR